MPTKCFIRDVGVSGGGVAKIHRGTNSPKLNGTNSGWGPTALSTTRGTAAGGVNAAASTVAGPTSGVEVIDTGAFPREFISSPVDQDVTISGQILLNIWVFENSMSANVAINFIVDVIRATDLSIVQIAKSASIVEAGTTAAAQVVLVNPPAGVLVNKGDRLRVRVFGSDAGTMAAGFSFTTLIDGDTNAASGDSYVTFTETFGFLDDTNVPIGTRLYLTDGASPVSTASLDKEAWINRGSGAVTSVTNTVTGWTAGNQITDSGGGTAIDWFSRPLQAFTLAGIVYLQINAYESAAAANASLRVEIARVNNDGTGAVVWGTAAIKPVSTDYGEVSTLDSNRDCWVSGDDLAITDGQRIRIRIYQDDTASASSVSGNSVSVVYAGTSAGASGDTYLFLTQSVSEFVSGTAISGTDANGTTTESASLVVKNFTATEANGVVTEGIAGRTATLPDANGATTEVAAIKLSAADANGVTTESGIVTVPVSASDANGTTTEATLLTFATTQIESGIGVDAATLVAKFTDVDIGSSRGSFTGNPTLMPVDPSALAGSFGIGDTTAHTRVAQSFRVPSYFTIDELSVWLTKVGSPVDNIVIEIQSDASGAPSGTVLATCNKGAATTSTIPQWIHIDSVTVGGYVLSPNTTYWLVLRRSGAIDAANYVTWSYGGAVYADGQNSLWNGTTWTPGTNDLTFKLLVYQGEIQNVTVPVSTTDANGVTTEAASTLVAPFSSADSNGTTTEAATFVYSPIVTDANGTITETAAVAVPIPVSDSGGLSNLTFGSILNGGVNFGIGDVAADSKVAQSFSFPQAIDVLDLTAVLRRLGTPADNIVAEIQTDNAGVPSGAVVGSTVIGAGLITTAGSTPRSLASGSIAGLKLDANKTYWLVLYRTGAIDGANVIAWYQASAAFAGGAPATFDGSNWTAQTGDMTFQFLSPAEIARIAVPVSSTDSNGATTEAANIKVASADINGATTETLAQAQTTVDINGTTTESASAGVVTTPVSSSDSNGATSESTLIAQTAQDANGAVTEAFALTAGITTVDANGTTTETGSPQFLTSTSDSGAGTETQAVKATYIVTDSGTDSEAFVLTAGITTLDTNGTTTEQAATTVPISASDSGIGAETQTLTATYIVTDSGTGAEVFTLTAQLLGTDTNGTTTEFSSTATFKTGTDSNGATTETASFTSVNVTIDSGSGSEIGSLKAVLSTSDANGTTTEAGSKNVAAVSTDTGTSADVASLLAILQSADLGSSSDILSALRRIVLDVGSGSESALVNKAFIVTDQGVLVDTGILQALVNPVDVGIAVDIIVALASTYTDAGYSIELGTIQKTGGYVINNLKQMLSAGGNESRLTGAAEEEGGRMTTTLSGKARLTGANGNRGRLLMTKTRNSKMLSGR